MKLWGDQVAGMAKALAAYDEFRRALDDVPSSSGLNFEVTVKVWEYGEPNGWSILSDGDTAYWEIEEETDE